MKKIALYSLVVLLTLLIIPNVTYAADSGLEIESVLDTILAALKGRIAWFIGVGSVILAAAGWAATEGGSMARSGFKIVMALAIMFNATRLAGKLYGASEGLGF